MNRSPYRHPFRWPALCLFVLATLPAAADRKAPSGTVTPRRGPLAGQICKYGDGSHKYTQLAEFTLAEILDYVSGKKPAPPGSEIPWFVISREKGDYVYGSQLSREGYDRYAELVRSCLEDGKVTPGKAGCRHRAPIPIGIHIQTGQPTAEYMVYLIGGYWIVEPGWLK